MSEKKNNLTKLHLATHQVLHNLHTNTTTQKYLDAAFPAPAACSLSVLHALSHAVGQTYPQWQLY